MINYKKIGEEKKWKFDYLFNQNFNKILLVLFIGTKLII